MSRRARTLQADAALDASLVLLGAALPLSLAATNAALAMTSAGLLAALSDRASRARALARLKSAASTPLFAALAFYAAASLVSGLAGAGPAKSLSIWPKDLHKLWVVLAVGASLDERRRVLFARGLAAGAAAAALVGLGQSASAVHAMLTAARGSDAYEKALAVIRAHGFIHPVSFGESMGLSFLGLLFAGEAFLSLPARRWSAAAVALVLVANQTRAAQLGVVAGFAAVAALRPRWRRAFAAVVVATIAVAAGWEFVVPHGRSLRDLLTLQGPQATRLTLWNIAVRMFLDHPWTGAGPGHYRTMFSAYFDGLLDNERTWGNAHNLFLHQAAERGLLGLGALFGVAWAIGAGLRRRVRESTDGWALWALASCAAFLVMNMTETAFQTEQVATLFLVIMLLPFAPRTAPS